MARDKTEKGPAATPATPATRTANEWGTPDWRDPVAYGDVTCWDSYRWRWEFYRRRDDLRACYDAHAAFTYAHAVARDPDWPKPEEPGFWALVDEDAVERFGYYPLPNPRSVDNSDSHLYFLRKRSGVTMNNVIDSVGGTFGELLTAAGVELTEEQATMLRHALACFPAALAPNEIALRFDMALPLEPQREDARYVLQEVQTEFLGKPVQRRRHQGKWLGYLRALDAREAGASWAEITDVFFAQGLLHRRKNPSGGYCAPPPQAARDLWEAANALRFNF